jgi:hypothetical protein
VIADPPFDPGALQVKFAEVFAGVPAALVGAPGVVRGVIVEVGLDGDESPARLVAMMVKV